MDEELMKLQAEIYKMDGVDDTAPAFDPAKKRKAALENVSDPSPAGSHVAADNSQLELQNKRAKADGGATDTANANGGATDTDNGDAVAIAKPRTDCAVFVTDLPLDVDSDEVRDVFSKYGMLAESAETNEKRVKVYYDEDGNSKGEALVGKCHLTVEKISTDDLLVYFRPESVSLAIQFGDNIEFPRDDPSLPTSTMRVRKADPGHKKYQGDTGAPGRSSKAMPSKAKTKAKAEEMNKYVNPATPLPSRMLT